MLFATHLAITNISYAIIKVYLSAIRQLHVTQGSLQYFNQQLTLSLQQTLKGIQKTQTTTNPPRPQLPITVDIMQDIKHLLLHKPRCYTNTMMWAACCLAFFGFLRVSEFTIPAEDQYDQSCYLSFNDVSLDNRDNPHMLKITIKQSKTGPFCKGVDILYLGATGHTLCPIKGILPYLALRGSCRGPLFLLEDGRDLTRQLFSTSLDNLLLELKRDSWNYSTHTFRIGAATSAEPWTYRTHSSKWWAAGEVMSTNVISKPHRVNW